jgi:hypothetical protein
LSGILSAALDNLVIMESEAIFKQIYIDLMYGNSDIQPENLPFISTKSSLEQYSLYAQEATANTKKNVLNLCIVLLLTEKLTPKRQKHY